MAFGVPGDYNSIWGNIQDGWQAFQDGGFNDENEWVPDLNVATDENSMTLAPEGVYDSGYFTGADIQSYMDDEQSYTPPPPSYASNADMQSYMDDSQSYSSFDPNAQINPAGTSSPDGMMTLPTNYLYPDERLGIDGIPYKPNAGIKNPAAYSYEPSGQGGSAGGGGGGSSTPASLFQDLSQRNPSGTQYAPDLSAYNQSSLYNYPGEGVNGYTYGQGLPTEGAGYGIWGTPTDMVNPYYEGQFSDPVEPEGPADGAISLPPIDLPEGVSPTNNNPNVGTSNTNINNTGGGGTGPGGKDLTYQETIDYFGLTPQSTPFPGPNDKLIEEQILNDNAIKQGLAPPPIIDKGGVHDTGAVPPTADQLRALSDINYGYLLSYNQT